MTEWRRTLKSWPMETAKIADPASLPEWVRAAARERREAEGSAKGRKIPAMLLTVFALGLLVFIDMRPSIDPLTWLLLAALFAACVPFGLSFGQYLERTEARRRQRTTDLLETRGESTLGGEFAGVSYAEGCWTYPGLGLGADEGVLQLDLDRLTFVGRHTRFELPTAAVLGTEIRRYDSGLGNRARLLVPWAHAGEAGTLSLALPYRRSTRRRVEEALDLQERIERWRREPFPSRSTLPHLPITMELTSRPNAFERIGLAAKLLSGVTTFTFAVLTFGGIEFGLARSGYRELSRHIGSSTSVLMWGWFFVWIWLAAKIEPRLPERYRYREKENGDVRDALRGLDSSPAAESVNDARLKH